MKVAIGCDHRGLQIKNHLVEIIRRLNHEVFDCGAFAAEPPVDYPDVAADVAQRVSQKEADRGILICGSGLGMCIAANKIRGIRAVPCTDDLLVEMSRRHNDSNVLCLSADMLGEKLIDRMVDVWLKTEFEGGRHARRIEKISALENHPAE